MRTTEKVRIVSVDKRYRLELYPFMPIFNSRLDNYITGQHVDHSDPTTFNYLTKEEIDGTVKLTPEKRAKFPHLIKHDERVSLLHLREFNISKHEDGSPVNPKDVAELNFFKLQEIVASSKDKVKPGQHYFYIEDKQAEAKSRVSERSLRYEAEKLFREQSKERSLKETALLLNHYTRSNAINVNTFTEVMIQDAILDACEKNPRDVIKAYAEGSSDDLFYLRLVDKSVIRKEGTSFLDGNTYLGDTIEDIKKFVTTKEGESFLKRWQYQLGVQENPSKYETIKNLDEDRYDTLLKECAFNMALKNYEKALTLYNDAIILKPNSKELAIFKEEIDSVLNKSLNKREELMSKTEEYLQNRMRPLGIKKEEYDGKTKEELVEMIITKTESK